MGCVKYSLCYEEVQIRIPHRETRMSHTGGFSGNVITGTGE
jgi:hypothetical protein